MLKNRRDFTLAAAAATVAAPAVAASTLRAAERTRRILVGGATNMQTLVRALGDEYSLRNPNVVVDVVGGGSAAGLIAVRRGAIDLGSSTIDPLLQEDPDEEAIEINPYLIARTALVIITNHEAAVRDLPMTALRRVFTGRIGNWQEIGGPDVAIQIVTYSLSPISTIADRMITQGDAPPPNAIFVSNPTDMLAAVADNPYAIGYSWLADVNPTVAFVRVDGVLATAPTLLSDRYPLTVSNFLVVQGAVAGDKAAFVQFARSKAGQAIVEQKGLIRVC